MQNMRINVQQLINKVERQQEKVEKEKRTEEYRKAQEEERKRQEEEKERQRLYNIPLPDFCPRLSHEVRAKFFTYTARVVNDAGRATAERLNTGILYDADKYWMDDEDLRSMFYVWKEIPASCLYAAFRISAWKGGGTCVHLHIFMENPAYLNFFTCYTQFGKKFKTRVEWRLKNNLLRNIPELQTLLGCSDITDVTVWTENREWHAAELKKSGYLFSNEEKVTHLEFF